MPKHTGQFKFWCGQCQRDFPHRDAYQAHMDKHEGITFPCQKCTKRFQTKISLKYHQSEHTGVYLYRCSVCNKGYNFKGDYTRHMKRWCSNSLTKWIGWLKFILEYLGVVCLFIPVQSMEPNICALLIHRVMEIYKDINILSIRANMNIQL